MLRSSISDVSFIVNSSARLAMAQFDLFTIFFLSLPVVVTVDLCVALTLYGKDRLLESTTLGVGQR